jgi:hypothetical protein
MVGVCNGVRSHPRRRLQSAYDETVRYLLVAALVLSGCFQAVPVSNEGPEMDASVEDAGTPRAWRCSPYPIPGDPPMTYDGSTLMLDIDGCKLSLAVPPDGAISIDGEWSGSCPGVSASVGTINRSADMVPADGTFTVNDLDVESARHEWHFAVVTCHEL